MDEMEQTVMEEIPHVIEDEMQECKLSWINLSWGLYRLLPLRILCFCMCHDNRYRVGWGMMVSMHQ